MRPALQTGSATAPQLDEGRDYVLYVGNACPWCHRTTIARALRGAEAMVTVVVMDDDPTKARRGGWSFSAGAPDPVFGAPDLKGVYDELEIEGRCTAPLLVERAGAFVSNESGDIARALIDYKGQRANDADLRPAALAAWSSPRSSPRAHLSQDAAAKREAEANYNAAETRPLAAAAAAAAAADPQTPRARPSTVVGGQGGGKASRAPPPLRLDGGAALPQFSSSAR